MNSLRIAFDMDGTLADLSTAFHQIEDRLFGPYEAEHTQPQPEAREEEQEAEQRAAQESGTGSGTVRVRALPGTAVASPAISVSTPSRLNAARTDARFATPESTTTTPLTAPPSSKGRRRTL